MPAPRHHRRRVVQGTNYASGVHAGADGSLTTASAGHSHLAHLTTSPEELGIIGAELAKRLTLAAEEFLTELAADQVRGSFRHELGALVEEAPED